MQKQHEPAKKIMPNYHRSPIKVNCEMGNYKFPLPSLVLVGTVHRDPKGYTRLSRLLEKERPALVTVEISPYSRAFRVQQSSLLRNTLRENLRRIQKKEGRTLRAILSHSLIMGIFFLLQEPFEWRAAKAYSGRHGILLYDIDLSPFAQDHLAHLAELIALKNLRTLLHFDSPSLTDLVQSQYSRAGSLFHHPPSVRLIPKEFQKREVYMAKRIRNLAQGIDGGKILHVGGWEHLIDPPEGNSLFGLLKDLRPKRVLLPVLAN